MYAIEISKETNEKLERIGRSHFMDHTSFDSKINEGKSVIFIRDSLMKRLQEIQANKGFDSISETVDEIADHFLNQLPTINRN